MSRTSLACSLVTALAALAAAPGCSSGRPGDGPDGGESPYDAAPFTNGVSSLAGAAEPGYFDGDRASGRFNDPVNAVWSPDGKLYVADYNNSKIRVVDTEGNSSTLVAQKDFIRPYGLLILADGTLLVETDVSSTGADDLMSGTLWKVDTGSGVATVLADSIGRPRGLALLPSGQVAMSDEFHHVIRTIDPSSAQIATLAGTWDDKGMVDGTGGAARFSTPYGMAVLGDGTLVVCDYDNARLRQVSVNGVVTTMTGAGAGFADGTMQSAQFSQPQAVALAANGDLYVADLGNYRVRKVSGGAVTTVAGDGHMGWKDSDDPLSAELNGLEGLTLSSDASTLYVTDGNRGIEGLPYHRIREVKL